MATNAQIRFGYFSGKNVVDKNVEYSDYLIDASSGAVRNMELTPAGGTVRLLQDVISSNSEKIYNYAAYVIGDLLYYGYVKCAGVAGGVVTYEITNDPVTTMWRAGAFNINNYCLYSPLGNPLFDDSRRTKSTIATTVEINQDENGTEWINDNIQNSMILMNVATNANSGYSTTKSSYSSLPVGIHTYLFTPAGFSDFFHELLMQSSTEFASYTKSIICFSILPFSYNNLQNVSFYNVNHVSLFNPASDKALVINVSSGAYKLSDDTGQITSKKILAFVPELTMPDNINAAPARYSKIKYCAGGFGEFEFTPAMFPKSISAIGAIVIPDFTGMTYTTYPQIRYTDDTQDTLYELSATGQFDCQFPILTETDLTNYNLKIATQNINTGAAVATSIISFIPHAITGNVSGSLNDATTITGALINNSLNIAQIEHNQNYSGGTIRGGFGSALYRATAKIYAHMIYYPYTDSTFQTVYNFPDYNLRNVYTDFGGSPGYVQTVNCNIYRLGYPDEIARAAENAFNSGVWIT